MFSSLAKSLFGDSNDREIKKFNPLIEQIAGFEPALEALDDDALKAKTDEFKTRHQNGESLDDLLPEAFATVREAAKRTNHGGQSEQDLENSILHNLREHYS